jgi:hypothetical protein
MAPDGGCLARPASAGQTQFTSHLNLCMGEMELSPRIDPPLHLLRYSLFVICHRFCCSPRKLLQPGSDSSQLHAKSVFAEAVKDASS